MSDMVSKKYVPSIKIVDVGLLGNGCQMWCQRSLKEETALSFKTIENNVRYEVEKGELLDHRLVDVLITLSDGYLVMTIRYNAEEELVPHIHQYR